MASTSSSKKRKTGGQLEIEDFYESRNLPESKVESINKALVRAFVCCGISFSVIDNPFFRELLYQLRPNYTPPSRKLLSGRLLDQETARINQVIDKELENSENLTLGILILFLFYVILINYKLILNFFYISFGWLDQCQYYIYIQFYNFNSLPSTVSLLSL